MALLRNLSLSRKREKERYRIAVRREHKFRSSNVHIARARALVFLLAPGVIVFSYDALLCSPQANIIVSAYHSRLADLHCKIRNESRVSRRVSTRARESRIGRKMRAITHRGRVR